MVCVKDKFGRTWKNRNIVWIRSANCAREALYRWGMRDGERVLIYDNKNGMYDKQGYHVKETKIEILPALEGKDEKGRPVPGTWERFPRTDEALSFMKSITPNGFSTQASVTDVNDPSEYDDGYDDDILIK